MTRTIVDRRTAPHPIGPPAPAPPASGDERVRAVLETARAVVDRGWLQHRWYETAPRSWRERLFGPIPTPDMLEGACLVAAVAVAGHAGGAFTRVDRDSGPSMDRLCDALGERHGRPVDRPGAAVAPVVRRARMRELVRWNDAPERTRGDVLDLLDRAISRTILDQVRTPAPR
ncbi:hypothetical protein [Pseudonocardia sp. KRD291]|uniref:DUF6197 family protein n=1 Tax=Pseudonocardia sp. KRD291 TaxID=2792007 RepID=UPI001C4A244A|nr:hypothetical protein [Pseudonocardia sp. KRD291]MBW0101152.1 hypothetical protein [Pseudonocardia sp. KRD291]